MTIRPLSILIALGVSGFSAADTILVPADQATIGAAIEVAEDGDLIFISAGTYLENDLLIAREITIEGEIDMEGLPAVTIDGQGGNLVYFQSTSGTAVMRNIRLTNGGPTATMCFHSRPVLANCTFSDSGPENPVAFDLGGAVYNLNGGPQFFDCRFLGNRGGFGGAFATWESGPMEDNHPRFERCLFRGNSGVNGGAMANLRSNPVLVDCVFEDNTASVSGGAIYNDGFDEPDFWVSRPVLEGCTFTNNNATTSGGAITNFGASEATITACDFSANSADAGGAITNDGSSFTTLSDSALCGNGTGSDQITGTWHDLGGNTIDVDCPTPCPGDLNGDGQVDGADLSALLGAWNETDAEADIDGDGLVDGADLSALLGGWGLCP